MAKYIYECTRPDEVSPRDHSDCKRCKFALCGYSLCFEFNEMWDEQGGLCGWEHCIENMPQSGDERTCPMFGHDCPGGAETVSSCPEARDWVELLRREGRRRKS